MFDFAEWIKSIQNSVETVAQKELPVSGTGSQLEEAMRYSVLGGGKRVRPLLVFASGTLTEAKKRDLDLVSLAVECVHCYSLVHDDLPCMDNDVLRHGKPTTHAQFGEAMAMLAGDALQPEAFKLILKTGVKAEQKNKLIEILARASSVDGMCGGQAIDLSVVGQKMTMTELEKMHRMKTGALLLGSVLMGAWTGKIELISNGLLKSLTAYGRAIGLAFQIVDDILDVTADSKTLGKTAGKDALEDKPTYVSLLGLDKAKELAHKQLSLALGALSDVPESQGKELLENLARMIVRRGY